MIIIGCSEKSSNPPILLLATQNNFGTYTGEILKAEGFNEFEVDSLNSSKISKLFLSRYELIIISEEVTDPQSWQLLSEYVRDGGNLIAVRPVHAPDGLFGITEKRGSIKDGYMTVDASSQTGKSLSGRKLQIHGIADMCDLNGGKAIAFLTERLVNNKTCPGAVMNNYRKGKTAIFLYNLPENIVLTRQGNPDFAGIEKDSIPGLRAMDMFTDGWVDTANNTINQADIQMTLLSYCIEKMSCDNMPLPRFWYFPDTLKCLVTLTNDGEFRGENDFEAQLRDIDSMGATMSLYILETGKVSKQWCDKWRVTGI